MSATTAIEAPAAPDFGAIKQRQQKMWSSGDYAAVGATLQIMSEQLCEAVDLRAGQRVLDVATGSGNAALAAARRFGEATGIDYVPALLDRARERAAAERLPATFVEGDAEALPFADGSFDVVLSVVGVMFAPNHTQAARELLRACRSGGTIGLASWTPDGFVGGMLRTVGRYVPPPAGVQSPVRWGEAEYLRELFGQEIVTLDVVRRYYNFRYRSPEHFVEFFLTHYGPTERALAAIDPSAREQFVGDLTDLARDFNEATDGTLVAPSAYLEVVATKR